ncbi:MAG: nitrogen fixation protein NifM [Chromatiales bacterium]
MALQPDGDTAEFNYHLLRNALNSFSKNLSQLTEAEYQQVYRKSNKSYDLESLVITSPEAQGLVIDDRLLDHAVNEVASRYADAEDFTRDLEINGLDELGLRRALYRELLFDAVMQRVAANGAAVNDIDVRLFYEMHRDRFEVPEQRLVSHILITVNPAFPENSPGAARARMTEVAEKLAGRSNRFAAFAKRYSECPTAMEGGKLGEVSRGQLYAELDAALFQMEENQISPIVESEMGLHILLCERIKPGKRVPLSKVATQIKETLEARQRRNCQKAWLAGL